MNLSSRSAFVRKESSTHDTAPQGIILLCFFFPPPPCLLFLFLPAAPLRHDSIDLGLNWGGELDSLVLDCESWLTKGGQRHGVRTRCESGS
jgi:hypothetical protein